MSSKCILPWISIETTPLGNVRPCCLYRDELPDIDLKTHTLQEAFDSKAMRDLRRSFRRGEKPDGCRNCWREEDAGKKSKREYMLEKFKDEPVDYSTNSGNDLVFIDLKLGNICNLKCRICGSWSSSTFAAEEVRFEGRDSFHYQMLKDGAWPRRNQKFWTEIDKLMEQIRYLEFTGGEPFMIQEHFDLLQRMVDQGIASNVEIHYNTNGTQFPEHAEEIWKHFKLVKQNKKENTN